VSQIEEGLIAEVRLSYQPDQLWNGKIAYIYPQIDEKTRTLKVRLVFDNPNELLKPNMYADVRLFGNPKPNALNIPREALIQTGGSERVILALGGGQFQPVEVKSGIESGKRVEILDGLREGEEIVISAQFLIDSEASIAGSAMRMLVDREVEAQP
jgi:Cu(I)/Ag(I) efflux system membrane fusion protein